MPPSSSATWSASIGAVVNFPAYAAHRPGAASARTLCRQSGRLAAPAGTSFWQEYQNVRRASIMAARPGACSRTQPSTRSRSAGPGGQWTGSGRAGWLSNGTHSVAPQASAVRYGIRCGPPPMHTTAGRMRPGTPRTVVWVTSNARSDWKPLAAAAVPSSDGVSVPAAMTTEGADADRLPAVTCQASPARRT
jgi:hypothetical protein